MINMELLNLIRRMSLRLKLPIRDIARRTGLSRKTVKKHLNAGTVEPKFAISVHPSKLDPFADKLAGWLKSEAGKSRKQRRTLKQLHAGDGHPRGIVDADMDIFPTDPARVALTLAVARCPAVDCTAIHERG